MMVEVAELTVAKIPACEQMNVYPPLWYEEESGFRYHGTKEDADGDGGKYVDCQKTPSM